MPSLHLSLLISRYQILLKNRPKKTQFLLYHHHGIKTPYNYIITTLSFYIITINYIHMLIYTILTTIYGPKIIKEITL